MRQSRHDRPSTVRACSACVCVRACVCTSVGCRRRLLCAFGAEGVVETALGDGHRDSEWPHCRRHARTAVCRRWCVGPPARSLAQSRSLGEGAAPTAADPTDPGDLWMQSRSRTGRSSRSDRISPPRARPKLTPRARSSPRPVRVPAARPITSVCNKRLFRLSLTRFRGIVSDRGRHPRTHRCPDHVRPVCRPGECLPLPFCSPPGWPRRSACCVLLWPATGGDERYWYPCFWQLRLRIRAVPRRRSALPCGNYGGC